MSTGLLPSFLGALQASVSILLVISYGVIAAQFDLLDSKAGKSISKICVRMFLPALLITKVGSELDLDTAHRYIPILIWALGYITLSLAIGLVAEKLFKFPNWVAPALGFNNTTSLPLLLIQSLESTGLLNSLISKDESTTDAIERAKSYFLVCAIVSNCLTFALGPRLIDGEHQPEKKTAEKPADAGDPGALFVAGVPRDIEHDEPHVDERTSLLPDFIRREEIWVERTAFAFGNKRWDKMTPRTQSVLLFFYDFLNAPLIGAVLGMIIGLTPALHKAFFNESDKGGFLNAWLTSSLDSIGHLFVSLQVVVVGVSLSHSLRQMKRGEESGTVPLLPGLFILSIRFVIWPVVSISIIWALATRTNLLGNDPMLWFAMMLMPTGPPAIKIVAMADVNDASDEEKGSISKLLVLSYMLCPVLAFTVVGALRATEAAM